FTGQPTATFTFTGTPTYTFSVTPTFTPTLSPTPPPVLTATFTPTPQAVTTVVVSAPYPNPTGSGPVTLDVQGQGIAQVKWDVFTTAFRKIFNGVQAAPVAHIAWNLKDNGGSPVASGLYFIRVEVDSINGRKTFIKKFLVIR